MMPVIAALEGRSALVFDLDGTLVDTLPDLWRGLQDALSAQGLLGVPMDWVRASLHGGVESTVDHVLTAWREGVAEAVPAVAQGRLALPERASLLSAYRQALADQTPALDSVYPGVLDLLAHARSQGWRLAVCTNKDERSARRLLAALGLLPFFERVVGADTCERRKPDPMPLRHALEGLDVQAAQAVMVGDSAVDADCAQAVGVPCVLHEAGYGADQVLAPVAARIGSYTEWLQVWQRATPRRPQNAGQDAPQNASPTPWSRTA